MIEVRRDDGELCGFVAERHGGWSALTVFRVSVGEWGTEEEARRDVHTRGLSLLSERWTLTESATGRAQVACIQQASPAEVTLALDHYSLPGVPTITIGVDELDDGRWRLTPGT